MEAAQSAPRPALAWRPSLLDPGAGTIGQADPALIGLLAALERDVSLNAHATMGPRLRRIAAAVLAAALVALAGRWLASLDTPGHAAAPPAQPVAAALSVPLHDGGRAEAMASRSQAPGRPAADAAWQRTPG